jgi:hypothetical protein
VLERVLRLGEQRLFLQQLGRRQRAERGPQLPVVVVAEHAPEHALAEARSHDRRGLEHLLLAWPQAVDAGRQHGMHAVGNRHLAHVARERVAPGLADEGALLRQRAHHLFDEERVAARPLVDGVEQQRQGVVPSDPLAEQLGDRLPGQRLQREPQVVRPVGPGRSRVRPDAGDHQGTRARNRVDELLDEGRAHAVDPLQVLHDEDRRLPAAPRAGEPPHQIEQAPLARLGVHARPGPPGVGHPEEVEQQRDLLDQRFVELDHEARDVVADGRIGLLVPDPEVGSQQLQDGALGERASVRLRGGF